jgi:ubiquinone/menaquinone biosynthesis C-methylase UbiE
MSVAASSARTRSSVPMALGETAAMPSDSARYTHGHHESVLRSHTWRTAANSCGYLLGHLAPGMSLLDVGCGPGTITADLARLVAPGAVVGIDPAPEVIETATESVDREGIDVTFSTGDVMDLQYPDGAFDVVHAHQVLQHLADPVGALVEMRRVRRPGGIVAARDSDYAAMTWFPELDGLAAWNELYHAVTARNGAQADAGRRLRSWAQRAGFAEVEASAATWCFADEASRQWWGDLWATRVLHSSFADQAREHGLADESDLQRISAAWREWAASEDGWFAVLHGEVLCRR